jgi:hypothetical protein
MSIKIISAQLLRLTDEEYFSDQYKDYISNSSLSLLDPANGGSVKKFKEGYKSDYNESFELGTAIHLECLQKGEYQILDIGKPTSKLGLFSEKLYDLRQKGLSIYKAIQEASIQANYYANKLNDKKIKNALQQLLPFYLERMKLDEGKYVFLPNRVYEKYLLAMKSVNSNSKFLNKLNPNDEFIDNIEIFNEYAILCEIEYKGRIIKFKGKLDNFTIDHENKKIVLNDLKTTGKSIKYFMGNYIYDDEGNKSWYSGSFQRYNYYRQMAVYLILLKAALPQFSDYTINCNMLVVETLPDYKSEVFKVSLKHLLQGKEEFLNLLALLPNDR